ncbi:MAG: LL-diaminopimelate aminotransferase [Candidatus Omnitrophica bacterium]|jgi:LL-diaminopimelate aminotransferase|nr:LL-diaminopimelate aminotransferase [Candidatus Omnitrophota bacterium]
MFKLSKKITSLPPYLFVEIDKAKRKARAEGRDIIDLGIGDPDQPTPAHVIERLYQAAKDPANHRYALDQGMPSLRQAMSKWYHKRFNVVLDPDTEILPLIGSKEGIAHFPLAFLNPGDYSLIPDPCYPPYKGGTILAGGKPYLMPLLETNNFLPDLNKISRAVLKKSRIIYVNYPNNPTASIAGKEFYLKLIKFAHKHKLIIVSDLAYSEMVYDNYRPPSILEFDGSRDVAIEFHSLSKTYNMTGWRVAWACGNKELIAGLAKVKSNIDSGIFSAVQVAALSALEGSDEHVLKMCQMYQNRRDALVMGLNTLGWNVKPQKATFYSWIKIPGKKSSIDFAAKILKEADIIVTPGVGFGQAGEGYIRIALTVPVDRIKEAVNRLAKVI